MYTMLLQNIEFLVVYRDEACLGVFGFLCLCLDVRRRNRGGAADYQTWLDHSNMPTDRPSF